MGLAVPRLPSLPQSADATRAACQ
uniref:Uncharacterized protein n=1 Tax=Arundo donax TaxID=35708 RepID=A0A0A9FE08_ARUDO